MGLTRIGEVFDLRGGSVAGEASSVFIRQLKLLFDCGFYHSEFLSARHVFLTHGHIDHCGGLFMLLGRNNMTGVKPFSVYIPEAIYADIMALKEIYERMNNVNWNWCPRMVCAGMVLDLSAHLSLSCYGAAHGAGAVSYGIRQKKNRLKVVYAGKSPEELRILSARGLELNEELWQPLLFYSGDTGAEIFDNEEIFAYENVIMECTFLDAQRRSDARKWRHLHIEDLSGQLHKFKSRNLILSHFSARYGREQINSAVDFLRGKAPEGLKIHVLSALI